VFDTYFDNCVSGVVRIELFISGEFVIFSPGWTLYSLMCGGFDGGGPGVCMSSVLRIFNGTATFLIFFNLFTTESFAAQI
jgi:hypothetical protein